MSGWNLLHLLGMYISDRIDIHSTFSYKHELLGLDKTRVKVSISKRVSAL